MKELSIEEKAKRYDEAKLRMSAAYNSNRCTIGFMNEIFPELKESEDERIREKVIDTIHLYYGEPLEDEAKEMIYWLEKQDEHAKFCDSIQVGDKVTRNEDGVLINLSQLKRVAKKDEKQGEQKPANTDNKFIRMRKTKPKDSFEFLDRLTTKVEPKFHEGDWVAINPELRLTSPICIKDIDYNNYRVESVDGDSGAPTIDCLDNHYHLWTIKDAKAGDVLVRQNGEMPFIFKERKDNHIYCYCGYTNRKDIFFDRFVNSEGEELHWLNLYHEYVYPATKEQCDLLFEKMKEAGYEWDAEKKELKKIEQKPAEWSEEDEELLNTIINHFKVNVECTDDDDIIKWLNSLKDRVQPQPQKEWGEEDEGRRKKVIHILSLDGRIKNEELSDINNWLKSLRPQNTWKPSNGQMDGLLWYLNNTDKNSLSYDDIESLYNDLKKLKQ